MGRISDEDKAYIIYWWGQKSPEEFVAELGLPLRTIRRWAKRLGAYSKQGGLSLTEVCRRTKYSHVTIRNVARRLGIDIRRPTYGDHSENPRSIRYKITVEDFTRICIELRLFKRERFRVTHDGEWGNGKPPQCRRCGTSARPHVARGLCKTCYGWLRYHGKVCDYRLTSK